MSGHLLTFVAAASILLAGTASAARAESPAGPTAFQVVTYNIRYDNPADGPDVWTNRREAMVK